MHLMRPFCLELMPACLVVYHSHLKKLPEAIRTIQTSKPRLELTRWRHHKDRPQCSAVHNSFSGPRCVVSLEQKSSESL